MHGLIEGRSVHYVDREGSHHAAIITKVLPNSRPTVNLFVPPQTSNAGECRVESEVPFDKDGKKPHTWCWIPRVE